MAFNFSAVRLDCFERPAAEQAPKDAHRRSQRFRRNPPAAATASGQKQKSVR